MESQEYSDDVTPHAQPVNALHTMAGGREAHGEETFIGMLRMINKARGYGIDTQALFQEEHEKMLLEEYMKKEEQEERTHAPSPVAADPLAAADATSAPSKHDPGPSPIAAGCDAEPTAEPKSAPSPLAPAREGAVEATMGPDLGEKSGGNQPAPVGAHANATQATADNGDVGEVCGHAQTPREMQRGVLRTMVDEGTAIAGVHLAARFITVIDVCLVIPQNVQEQAVW
ncbi:unnamed protein product [Closterium sp. Yama58-4]|nr:unnamed protein product [Closterium sp. Yama58-4]